MQHVSRARATGIGIALFGLIATTQVGFPPEARAHGDCVAKAGTPWKDGSVVKGSGKFKCTLNHQLRIKVDLQYWAGGKWNSTGTPVVKNKSSGTFIAASDSSGCRGKMRVRVQGWAFDSSGETEFVDTKSSAAVTYC